MEGGGGGSCVWFILKSWEVRFWVEGVGFRIQDFGFRVVGGGCGGGGCARVFYS